MFIAEPPTDRSIQKVPTNNYVTQALSQISMFGL